MLGLINEDREANGLAAVAWDEPAARAGAQHAADMAAHAYFSHWNRAGYGPDYRYNQAGGRDSVQENIFTYAEHFSDGSPAPLADYAAVVRDAQVSLMDSPGHRANILTPEHTHVGVGFAYNPETGSFYVAQEFVNRYVALEPLPEQAQVGEEITVVGRLLPDARDPTINLTYQPFPERLSVATLNATSTYERDAEIYQALPPEYRSDGSFEAQAVMNHQWQAGIYSVRVWVLVGGQEVLASEWLLEVE